MKRILFYTLTVSVISFLSFLFVRDYRKGGVNLKQTSSCIRVISLALLILLSAIDICVGPEKAGTVSALENLQMSGVVLLFSPHSYMKRKNHFFVASLAFAALSLLTSLTLALTGATLWKPGIFTLLAVGGLGLNACLCLKRKYSSVKPLFQNKAAWHSVEDYASHCYALLLLSSVSLALLPAWSEDLFSMLMILPSAAALFLAILGAYRKSADSEVIFLNRSQRLQMENIMAGNVADRSVKVQNKMNAMFDRIVKYLEEKQPYLEENFSIGDLADAMLSNRVYISRTINSVSGNNFCSLINSYRVKYSQMIWKNNPKLLLKEIYSKCGFHSDVSFINAFRAETGYTPVEWLKETQVYRLKCRPQGKDLAA